MYPETAIDFNRYRLGRCAADMHSADPATHRWGNGRPLDYRAGFRGDEMMYNSENGVWQGYSAPAPYQFLQGTFALRLAPTGAAEPRDLSITTRQSLTETRELNINLYGHWIDGVGHTKRLRTVDPLYGDLFGWTGNEHCNAGDYIQMVGIKDHHHRRPPYDAFNLVRRTCYAFITGGVLYPCWLGKRHDDELFVKTLVQEIDGRPYVCVYAANFTDVPQTLDVLLPLDASQAGPAPVFDERSWDWAVHERRDLSPRREQRFTHETAPLSAWMVAIPIGPDALALALGLPPAAWPTAPIVDEHVDNGQPVLRFDPIEGTSLRQQIEVAREARFREQDRVELSSTTTMTGRHKMAAAPAAGQRLWWRVRSVEPDGRGGPWSSPQAFVYKWPEYARSYPSQPRADRDVWRQTPCLGLAGSDPRDRSAQPDVGGRDLRQRRTHEFPQPALRTGRPTRSGPTKPMKSLHSSQRRRSGPSSGRNRSVLRWSRCYGTKSCCRKNSWCKSQSDGQTWTNLLARDANIEPLTTIELNEPVTRSSFASRSSARPAKPVASPSAR